MGMLVYAASAGAHPPICQFFHSQCMECVPLMPSNAWHDQGADSTSQVWWLTFLSISRQKFIFSKPLLSFPCCLSPTLASSLRWEKCNCWSQSLRVACPACQWARGETTYFSSVFPSPVHCPVLPPLRSAVFALLNAHSCQSWYGMCCCSVGIFLLSAQSSWALCFAFLHIGHCIPCTQNVTGFRRWSFCGCILFHCSRTLVFTHKTESASRSECQPANFGFCPVEMWFQDPKLKSGCRWYHLTSPLNFN